MISKIENIIKEALKQIQEYFVDEFIENEIHASLPNSKIHCHYCSNFLFTLRPYLKPGFEEPLKKALLSNPYVASIDFLSGYVNFRMKPKFFEEAISQILNNDIFPNVGNGMKTNVEYCSINPTGFLHIGHARNAILGDTIARILKNVNFDVTKEYYINDGGNQIHLLTQSVYARYAELNGQVPQFPENGYLGPEIIEIAKLFKEKFEEEKSNYQTCTESEILEEISTFCITYFMHAIKTDLQDLRIYHDVFSSEKNIIESGYIQKAIELLNSKGYLYDGSRDGKKAVKGDISNDKLLLLKTTEFGDDEDRPLTKSNGSWTYLAPDIGYHLNKIERNFEYLICILGADHDSYARRIKIAVQALKENIIHKTPICQMVSFELEGKNVKFSKRSGNSIRTHDFIQEVSPDIFRYMMLSKTPGTPFIFDYENATAFSMKNPVFYIQYAHARGCSILRNTEITPMLQHSRAFETDAFCEMIVLLSNFKNMLEETANQLAPHLLANYAYKLAESFHKVWQLGKMNTENKFIIDGNDKETAARLAIVQAFLNVLHSCLDMLGINAPTSMQ